MCNKLALSHHSCSRFRRQSKHANELRFPSRLPRRHVVRAGLAITAATMFLERAAAEQRSIFCAAAAELRATKISVLFNNVSKKRNKTWHLVSYEYELCSFYSSVNVLAYITRNWYFKRLKPHFRFSATRSATKEGTETAVALPRWRECTKGAYNCLAKYRINGKIRSYNRMTKYHKGKNGR